VQDLPHHYRVSAQATPEGDVSLSSQGLPGIDSGPPSQFGGSGKQWSPETLLTAAVADCFVLSFRAVAAASKLAWLTLDVSATGTLGKVERSMRFTQMDVKATLRVPAASDPARAQRLLERAEQVCLIGNSLVCPRHLEAHVEVAS
jgi:organic hydroperoxide reductase OsmC/OhrA